MQENKEDFRDVTFACDDQQIGTHKLIFSFDCKQTNKIFTHTLQVNILGHLEHTWESIQIKN